MAGVKKKILDFTLDKGHFIAERNGTMKLSHSFETKLWSAITAVASGIITSLLSDFISNTSYILQQNEKQYILVQTNNMYDTIFSISVILLTFFSLWAILTIIIQIGNKIYRQLKFNKLEKCTGTDLVNLICNTKEKLIKLNDRLYNKKNNIFNTDIAKLQIRELANIITTLHVKFKQYNQHKNIHMNKKFRHLNHASIINTSYGVSTYEFFAIINLLDKMLIDLSSLNRDDKLMKKDCNEMAQMLHDLKKIADKMKKETN